VSPVALAGSRVLQWWTAELGSRLFSHLLYQLQRAAARGSRGGERTCPIRHVRDRVYPSALGARAIRDFEPCWLLRCP
jgi:hypothetical protein